MKGHVKEVGSFLIEHKWLFKIEDDYQKEYLIMDLNFYKTHKLKTPVTKRELDSLDEKMSIDFEFITIEGKNYITKLKW